MTQQRWEIKGQTYTREDLKRLREMGLDPRKDKIERRFLSPNYNPEKEEVDEKVQTELKPEATEKVEEVVSPKVTPEPVGLTPEEQAELDALTAEKAWLKKDSKDRYKELKSKSN